MSLSKYNASLIISLICVQMLDCIKQKFVEYVTKIHKNEYSTRCNNQILPWTINLTLEGTENNNNGHKTKSRCNLKSLLRQSSLNMEFFNKASKYELNGCKGNVVWIFKLLIFFSVSQFLYLRGLIHNQYHICNTKSSNLENMPN